MNNDRGMIESSAGLTFLVVNGFYVAGNATILII